MQPELEMIAPVVFAFATFLTVWFTAAALETTPNSGVLIIHDDNTASYTIS